MATQQLEKTETAGVERASQHRVYSPAVDIYEHNDHVVLLADMPGVDKDSIDVTLEKDLITLNGKVKDLDAGKRPLAYSEYGVGDYQRSFQLGSEIDQDKIEASMKNGVLKLILPKVVPSKKKIAVNG